MVYCIVTLAEPQPAKLCMQKTDRELIERAARLYNSNKEASEALGIHPSAFGRVCRKYGIETPGARKLRLRRRASQ